MATQASSPLDHDHRALSEGAGMLERADRAHVDLRGPDAAEYLQGQVTNDVQALEPGEGCYAAMLNPKGRILADMRILVLSGEELWLDLEAVAREAAVRELKMYKIGRRVEVQDTTAARTIVSIVGPRSRTLVEAAGLVEGPVPHAEYAWIRGRDGVVIVATDAGLDLVLEREAAPGVQEELLAAGAQRVSAEAAEIDRIERGRPRYGVDMGDENLPGEAGIVDRAVSFTKGCYVGQEPVARMYHKGHPNRHLRGLELSAAVPPGTVLTSGEKEVGRATSAGVSAVHGPVALAILRREVGPGDELGAGAGVTARAVELPFGDGR
jgi:folate-binding protein YgfZ